MKRKYIVTMTKEFCILAGDEFTAKKIAIEKCADNPELLTLKIKVVEGEELPNSLFD